MAARDAPLGAQPAARGTAAKRRAQGLRSTARHLKWVIALQQADLSHHTHAPGSSALSGSFAAVVAELRAEIDELRSIIISRHGPEVSKAPAVKVPSEQAANTQPKQACPSVVPPCADVPEGAAVLSQAVTHVQHRAAAAVAHKDADQIAESSIKSNQPALTKEATTTQSSSKLCAQAAPRPSAISPRISHPAVGRRTHTRSPSSSASPARIANTSSLAAFEAWFMHATEEELDAYEADRKSTGQS